MCKFDGCDTKVFSNGFCHAHYDANRKANAAECVVDGCGNPIHSKGKCNKHYREELQKSKPECEVQGCTDKIVAYGLCDKHRNRLKRHGHLQQTRPENWGKQKKHSMYGSWSYMKQMSATIPMDERWLDFWKFVEDVGERPTDTHRLVRIDDALGFGEANFKWVEKQKDQTKAERARVWRSANPAKAKNSYLKTKYGITLEDYSMMFLEQNGCCKICGEKGLNKSGGLHVDHCHTTSAIRGLLCSNCNRGVGCFKDSQDLLLKAVAYLE